jgi:hypothetical protein
VAAASAAMFVHPNTFRYRLRRLTEVSGIDLSDPEQRFAAMLQLRAVYPAEGPRLCPDPGWPAAGHAGSPATGPDLVRAPRLPGARWPGRRALRSTPRAVASWGRVWL